MARKEGMRRMMVGTMVETMRGMNDGRGDEEENSGDDDGMMMG